MTDSPNFLAVGVRVLRSQRLRSPKPSGGVVVDHADLQPVLDDLAAHGIASLPDHREDLERYRSRLEHVDPDELGPADALAFWLNLYNAGALRAAIDAIDGGVRSVLRVPGAFSRRWADVAGEALSLDDIEHGKVRRFGDPRVHAALVCGSVSCPTLRREPFIGKELDRQLEDQMRTFLAFGAASIDRRRNTISLSRIFLWYGGDFVRPDTMPAFAPADSGRVRDTVAWWLPADDQRYVWKRSPDVEFQPYDWGVACSIA
jgi:hypothetical protein